MAGCAPRQVVSLRTSGDAEELMAEQAVHLARIRRADAEAKTARRTSQLADRQAGAITASYRTTTASPRADLENAKAANRHPRADLTALRRRLGELTGRQVLAETDRLPARQQAPGRPGSSRNSSTPGKHSPSAPRNSKPPGRSTASSWLGSTRKADTRCPAQLCTTANQQVRTIKYSLELQKRTRVPRHHARLRAGYPETALISTGSSGAA
jgi:hypothetical protein